MFNSIKRWLNDNDSFGTRIRKCYLTLVKRETIHETQTPVTINIQKIESKPKPFDDSSFLTSILMEIQSRQLFLNANYNTFSNSRLYILEYDNLIEQLKNCLSISTLSSTELQERINILDHVKVIEDHFDTLKPISHNPNNELKVDASSVESTKEELGPIPEEPAIQIPIMEKNIKEEVVAAPVIQVPGDVKPIKDMILVPSEDNKTNQTIEKPIAQSIITDSTGKKYISRSDLEDKNVVSSLDRRDNTITARSILNAPKNDNNDEIIYSDEFVNYSSIGARELKSISLDDKQDEIVED
jgi:hypothetical protein